MSEFFRSVIKSRASPNPGAGALVFSPAAWDAFVKSAELHWLFTDGPVVLDPAV
ncbi:DUF397 domain-containing protein [Nocardia rhamnosiphila]